MKRKFLLIFLSLVTVVCLAFGLSACDIDIIGTIVDTSTDSRDSAHSSGSYNSAYNNDNIAAGYSETVKVNGITYGLRSDHYVVTSVDDDVTNAEILSEIEAISTTSSDTEAQPLPVTSINSYVFMGKSSLTSVTIPDSITAIEDCEFMNCTSLKTVVIGNGVVSIGESAFGLCTSLESVVFGNNITSIGYGAFGDCTPLTEINLPESLVSLSVSFNGCTNLESITIAEGNTVYHSSGNCLIETASKTLIQGCKTSVIPSDGSVTVIGENAFMASSITEITIPDSVETIETCAFDGCNSLTKAVFGNGVKYIEESAFENCDQLGNINLPSGLVSIGSKAFMYCYSFTNITIPDSVTSVGYSAFASCTGVQTLTLGNSLETIGDGAFQYLMGINNITIPATVNEIGSQVFAVCSSLTEIIVEDGNTCYKAVDGNLYSYDGTELIQYACGKTDTSFTIPDGVTKIGDGAFYDNDYIQVVIMPDSITHIGKNAFYRCTSLRSVRMSKNLTYIGSSAFHICWALTEIEIPDSVTYIGSQAFFMCSLLTEIVLPANLTYIGSQAFLACNSLTSATFTNTENWRAINVAGVPEEVSMDVSDPETNATNFTGTYYNYKWYIAGTVIEEDE